MAGEPVIYLVGGSMRVGKTIIAARFNALTGVSIVSSDDIIHMLQIAQPELGVNHDDDAGWRSTRDRVASHVEALADFRCAMGRPLLIEGELHPDMVARLYAGYPGLVRACFVGNLATSLETKTMQLKSHALGGCVDWLTGMSDDYTQDIAIEVLAAGKEYATAAVQIGVPFFDLSPDFEAGVENVLRYLRGL